MAEYRKCAGVIVFNREKKVLVCARSDKRQLQWQFPQGGIMKKESAAVAARRELEEETSIRSVELVATAENSFCYDFPASVRRAFQKRGIYTQGQEMFWSLFYFNGEDSEINLQTKQPEFKAYEWVDFEQAVSCIVYFKKSVYEEAYRLFSDLIKEYDVDC